MPGSKSCPTCQKQWADTFRFCPEDGAPLAHAAGADEFIVKPFTNQDLLSRITAHLIKASVYQ